MNTDITVVIGAGGMGMAIARRIACGSTLLLADSDADVLDAAAGRLREEGHEVSPHLVDVSDGESVGAFAATAARSGRLCRIAHTAGLSPVQADAAAVLRVDLLGVAHMLDHFSSVVAAGGAGVVIASMAGHPRPALPSDVEDALATTPTARLLELSFLTPEFMPHPGLAYVFAKRANILRVQAAAATWGRNGARINSISPGIISTSMGLRELAGPAGDLMSRAIANSGTGRIGTADDIAAAAEFLLSRRSSFITGVDLLVDGGVTAANRIAAADLLTVNE
ncbi:SDR family oxidoreductase [Nocardia aobensis]|uniref:SDR family oxidoreductase n=1 Tax=Nocardia aobensis TaxID=257277 RepID=A0ABW6PA25_9NOCA